MMKLAVLVACIALSLQVDARYGILRRDVENNKVSVPELKVDAPWKNNVDEGYPKFDGNPFKQTLVEITSMLAYLAAEALEDEKDVPPFIMSIVKGAQKTNWKNFDEYLNYWGSRQIALMEVLGHEEPKLTGSVASINDSEEDDQDDEEQRLF